MRNAKYRFILLPLFVILACVYGFAQANSTVTGIVTDQTGAVVGGAQITLTDPATGETHKTVSGGTGLYDISGLNPASYNLKVVAKGFEAFVQNGIQVYISATFRVDAKMTVGAENQTVTVEADALQVQADSNVVSTLISSEQISEIATENRNFAALAALGLGVSSALPDSNTPTSVAANFTISVNGLRQSHNIWLIDGGEADDRGGAGGMDIMPAQDAIAEFNMMTSNYPPDYGISSGATMSLSLKSGTQKFHGEGYDFYRTTAFDANSFFNKLAGNGRTPTHYQIPGFNIGGPLYIPGLYNQNKDKTFFFWNEEWRSISASSSANVNAIDQGDIPTAGSPLSYVQPAYETSPTFQMVVPNVDLKSSYYLNQLAPLGLVPNHCFTGQTTFDASGNPHCTGTQVIPAALFDPNAILYFKTGVVPSATFASGDKYIQTVPTPIKVRDDVVRVDHNITDKWHLLGHYMHDSVTQAYAQPMLGWSSGSYRTILSTLSNPSNSAALKLSGTISSNLLMEASMNYDGNIINITDSKNSNVPAGWGITPIATSFKVTKTALPGISFSSPISTSEDPGSAPWHNAAEDYEPKVDVSYTTGKHAMKYGFSYNRYTKNQQIFGDEQGSYNFGTQSEDSVIDMLLGLSSGYSQFLATPIRHYVNQTPSAYIMDNWHATPKLTLQLGLRYDALPHAWERNNAVSNFNPANYNQAAAPVWTGSTISATGPGVQTINGVQYYLNGMSLAGVAGLPRGLVNADYKTIQPRIGFSEDIGGNGKTVLRGGFGTFYERMQGNDIYNAATSVPFAYNPSLNSTFFSQPGLSWENGTNTASNGVPVLPTGVTSLSNPYRAPAVAQFSLGLQREIAPSVIWVVQYVGNLAWHQNIDRNLNNMPVADQSMTAAQVPGSLSESTANLACLQGDPNNHYPGGADANCVGGLATVLPAGLNQFRTYQGYGGINQQENTTNGSYNGFQTGLRVQNKWGLSGELDYTYSHEIDITSYDLSGVSNPFNLKYDKGSGALDRRQMLGGNYVYKIPFFAKGTDVVHSLLGGWEIAGTFVDSTGVPVVVTGAGGNYDPVGLGGGYTVRPNISGKVTYNKKLGSWFDTSKFSPVIPSWLGGPNLGFGTAGKDAVVGPGRVNFTTSVYKSFAITERAHFELRVESFNTFNHTEPNGLNTGYDPQNGAFSTVLNHGNQFGQVTGTQDPRALEVGGKFIF
jgi:hypothetical protein